MGLFMDPRRRPEDTRGSWARRRAPWLVLISIGSTLYLLTTGGVKGTGGLALIVLWFATAQAVAAADWSDLRKK